jgi:outer membrane protein
MSLKTTPLRVLAGAFALVLGLAAAAPLAAQQATGLKIAVLDTEQILLQSATGKAALEELRTRRERKEGEGKALQTEVQQLRDRLSEGRLSLSQDKIAELEKQLEDKAISLRRFEDDANRELTKKREEVLAKVDSKVMPIINAYGQEMGYDLIFRKFESGLIYADEGVDVTPEIIRRLDASGGTGAGG